MYNILNFTLEELQDWMKENKESAFRAKQVFSWIYKAIWNFAHTDLNLPDNIIVENVHLSESLMRLSYNITRYNEEHEGK